jgi:oxygen-dependent protoporphyrinogen oxidase
VPASASPRVAVVGGGISGLAVAHRLRQLIPEAEVVVLEASPRIGGSLRTSEVAGVRTDVGAEAMLNRRPEAVALAREVGLGDDVVHPATASAGLWTRGRVRPLPRTLMGVPVDLDALEGVISPEGVARAAREPDLPPMDLAGRDISVGDLVEQRLGPEIVDRLVEPLLGGVYAGHAREISARAAVPQVVSLLETDPSLLRAAATAIRPDQAGTPPVFAGLVDGIGRLPSAVARSSGASVRTGATVRELHHGSAGWQLVVGSTRDAELVEADAVVLATPARPTSRLLTDVAPTSARSLGDLAYASMAVVTLAVPTPAFPETDGSGFLVPPVDGHAIKASTFSFAKWDWVRAAGEASHEPVRLLRCSLGRHREEQVLQRTDDELVALALEDLADAIGLRVPPVDAHVQRWGGALPQYAVGHLDLVATVRREMDGLPGLAVCGSAYDGVGIPACIASAHVAAAKLVGDLARMGA